MRSFLPVAALVVVLALLVLWCSRPSDRGTPAVPAPTAEPSSREAGPRELVLDVAVEDATRALVERREAAEEDDENYAAWLNGAEGGIQVVDELTGKPQGDAVLCFAADGAMVHVEPPACIPLAAIEERDGEEAFVLAPGREPARMIIDLRWVPCVYLARDPGLLVECRKDGRPVAGVRVTRAVTPSTGLVARHRFEVLYGGAVVTGEDGRALLPAGTYSVDSDPTSAYLVVEPPGAAPFHVLPTEFGELFSYDELRVEAEIDPMQPRRAEPILVHVDIDRPVLSVPVVNADGRPLVDIPVVFEAFDWLLPGRTDAAGVAILNGAPLFPAPANAEGEDATEDVEIGIDLDLGRGRHWWEDRILWPAEPESMEPIVVDHRPVRGRVRPPPGAGFSIATASTWSPRRDQTWDGSPPGSPDWDRLRWHEVPRDGTVDLVDGYRGPYTCALLLHDASQAIVDWDVLDPGETCELRRPSLCRVRVECSASGPLPDWPLTWKRVGKGRPKVWWGPWFAIPGFSLADLPVEIELPAGEYELSTRGAGGTMFPVHVDVRGATASVVLGPLTTVRGILRGEMSGPLGKARLTVTAAGGSHTVTVRTDEDGTFEILLLGGEPFSFACNPAFVPHHFGSDAWSVTTQRITRAEDEVAVELLVPESRVTLEWDDLHGELGSDFCYFEHCPPQQRDYGWLAGFALPDEAQSIEVYIPPGRVRIGGIASMWGDIGSDDVYVPGVPLTLAPGESGTLECVRPESAGLEFTAVLPEGAEGDVVFRIDPDATDGPALQYLLRLDTAGEGRRDRTRFVLPPGSHVLRMTGRVREADRPAAPWTDVHWEKTEDFPRGKVRRVTAEIRLD